MLHLRLFRVVQRKFSLSALACFALLALPACKQEQPPKRGQLMIVLQTDMSLPKDVSRVRVQIQADGILRHDDTYVIKPDGKIALPATLAVVAGEKKNPTVEVRVIGLRRNEARVFAKVVTTIPSERTALLHVPVQWLCDDSVLVLDEDTFESKCEPEDEQERSCRAGSCVPVDVAQESLPDYEPEDVFGGSQEPGDPLGLCFNTEACFDQGFDVSPNAECQVDVPLPANHELNLALRLTDGGDGLCGTQGCYVPIDNSELFGWAELERDDERVLAQLPPAVCEKLDVAGIAAVRASTACQTKTAKFPTCGPWSSVETAAGIQQPMDIVDLEPDAGVGTSPSSPAEEAGVSAPTLEAGPGVDAAVDSGPVAPPVPQSLSLVVEAETVALGRELQLTASADFGDAGMVDVSAEAVWESSDESIASIEDGRLVSHAEGEVTLTATVRGVVSEPISVQITAPELESITIRQAPEAPEPGVVQLEAIGVYSDGSEADLTNAVTWMSENEAVVSVDAETGQASANGVGMTQVTATLGEISDSIPFNVSEQSIVNPEDAGTADASP